MVNTSCMVHQDTITMVRWPLTKLISLDTNRKQDLHLAPGLDNRSALLISMGMVSKRRLLDHHYIQIAR